MKDINDMTNGELVDEVIRQLKIDYPGKSDEELRLIILMGGDNQRYGEFEVCVTDAPPEARLKAMVENSRRKIEDKESKSHDMGKYDLSIRIEDLLGSGGPRIIKKDG